MDGNYLSRPPTFVHDLCVRPRPAPAERLLARFERAEEDAPPEGDPHDPRGGPFEEGGGPLLVNHPHQAVRDSRVHRPAVPLHALRG
eukprot:3801401-Pyramimonas_sp.AAC.1